MNDLRLILLGIGFFVIAVIYIRGISKQKRSHLRKMTSFERDSPTKIKTMSVYDEVNTKILAKLSEFLSNPKVPGISLPKSITARKPIIKNDNQLTESKPPKLASQTLEKNNVVGDGLPAKIISLLIKPSFNNEFSGINILEATKSLGMKLGDMKIFHHYGKDALETNNVIFSMASMYEPGYFELEKMETFQTKGLVLFMQLPAPMDNLLAFDLMQETVMSLADLLQGEIWASKNKPIDEKALLAMRDIVAKTA